jgi:hypothetical protein
MRSYLKVLLTAAVLFTSVSLWAQEVQVHPDLLARLSYERSAVVTGEGEGVRQVCIAVSRDGDYRIVRSLDSGKTQRLQGTMAKEPLQQLKALLDSAGFQGLSGNHGGLIRGEAESFGAEIPLADVPGIEAPSDLPRARRLQWLNADGESPFPASVSKVVHWLTHFEPKDAKELEYVEHQDVCPSVGLRLLQPSMAENLNK